jgi:hypothetical protein
MRHLPGGMHPGIGAPGGGDGVRSRFQPGQCRLDRSLHRGLVGLSLPTRERAAVVGNFQGKAWHGADYDAGRAKSIPTHIAAACLSRDDDTRKGRHWS